MSKLFLKLAESGHNITIIDTTAKKGLPDYGFNNIHMVDMRCGKDYFKKFEIYEMVWEKMDEPLTFSGIFEIGDMFLNDVLKEKSYLLPAILETDFDVIILDDLASVHGMFISELLYKKKKTPTIQYGTTFQLEILRSSRAYGSSFLNEPTDAGPLPREIVEVFHPGKFTSRTLNAQLEGKFSFQNHFSKSAIVLSEAFWGLGLPISQGNDLYSVGGYCPEFGALDKEMEEFLNDPKSKGTIILAFGSYVKWYLAPQHILDAYFGAFENLTDYRIVFSYDGEPREVPKHVKLSPWAPQKDILNHPKTKIFISHSGIKSTNEALCAGIPLILMPCFADQKYNSEFFSHLGYSEFMNKYYLTKEIVLQNIHKVLDNFEEKKRRILKVRSMYIDRVMNPMDLAEFYVIRTAKKKEDVIFKRKGIFLSWNEYLNIDFFVSLIGLIWLISK
ncbi:hypothetical protein FO519_008282 [Halicephalobus sp. NKZ332]|nr:hypothetical protein FO519_008282 [Halicephalobus sp. NKZ332]